MWFLLVFFYVFANTLPSFCSIIGNNEPLCPPPDAIEPCTCFKDSGRVTALCRNISNNREIKKVFAQNPNWNLQDVHFDQCAINYIPSSIVRTASFQTLNVTSSTLVSLFDDTPVKTPEINVYLYDVKILRGVQWEFFSNSSLVGFSAWNVNIRQFGSSFKEHVPQIVKYLWFERTKTVSITHQAFQNMVNVKFFTLMGGSLKKISRNMFPRPWNIRFWNLSDQKLSALPKDLFVDLPELVFFIVANNFFTTISEELFTEGRMNIILNDNPIVCNCDVKWIVTSKNHFIGTCTEPESYKGRDLEKFTKEDFRYCR